MYFEYFILYWVTNCMIDENYEMFNNFSNSLKPIIWFSYEPYIQTSTSELSIIEYF